MCDKFLAFQTLVDTGGQVREMESRGGAVKGGVEGYVVNVV
jgi:hypothetical protein